MRVRRVLALGLLAGALTAGATLSAYQMAEARARPVVVLRFLMGYFDARGRFVATAGRDATEVDRNAVSMFVFSGAVASGPNQRATLPCTLDELDKQVECSLDTDDVEPGVVPRRRSPFRGARVVATGSVTPDSVRIAAQGVGGSEEIAEGVYFKVLRGRRGRRVAKNRILFNPRFRQATFGNPAEIDYNPDGLAALTEYQVRLQGGADISDPFNVVTNRSGTPLAAPFQASFTTSDGYVQDFTRPQIRTFSPTDGAVNVPSDADIDITFDEPMDLRTFQPLRFDGDPQATVTATYSQSNINPPSLQGRRILGSIRAKPQTSGNVVQFRPLQGLGQGPYEVTLTITAGVTDLSGNNIIRQRSITFTTQADPNADNIGEITEDFDDKQFEDLTFATPSGDNLIADWGALLPSHLSTEVLAVQFDTLGSNVDNSTNLWHPNPLDIQLLFPSVDFGSRPRTITQADWFSGATNNSLLTYPNTQVRMGHATDLIAGGGFPGGANPPGPRDTNYRDVPDVVAPSQTYTVVAPDAELLVPGPSWNKSWDYDGDSAVIMQVSHGGNGSAIPPTGLPPSDFWDRDGNYVLNGLTASFNTLTPPVNVAQPHYYSVRWTYLTPGAENESVWYDTSVDQLRFQPQQIIPLNQPQGTTIAIQWQGAKGDPTNTDILDATSVTEFRNDIRELANHRYVRFRVTFTNNLQTGATPSIDKLIIPFTYR